MKKYKRRNLWPALLICFLLSDLFIVYGQTEKPQKTINEVLFVGNSYTYVHKLPLVVSAMAKAKGKDLTCSMSVAGGATLEDHLNGKLKL